MELVREERRSWAFWKTVRSLPSPIVVVVTIESWAYLLLSIAMEMRTRFCFLLFITGLAFELYAC